MNHHNQAEPAMVLYLINTTLLRSWVLVHVLALELPQLSMSRRGATIVVGDGQRDHDLVELFKHKLGGLRARGPTLGSQGSGMGCQKSDVWLLRFGSQQRTQHPGPYKAPVKREDCKLVCTFQNLLAMSVACPNQSKTRSIVLVFFILYYHQLYNHSCYYHDHH